jgi:hypothetical protein
MLKIVETSRKPQFSRAVPVPSGGMVTILFALVSLFSFRFRSRASLELELVALRHQVIVLRRQRTHRLRLLSVGSFPGVAEMIPIEFSSPAGSRTAPIDWES